MDFPEKLNHLLNERKRTGSFRKLNLTHNLIDFTSNDYLGMASLDLSKESTQGGATGSRLLSGHSEEAETAEAYFADFFQSEASLIYNSGYTANSGLLSAILHKGDSIFYDELSHSSIKDGIRLSLASKFSFKHNDLNDLEKKLHRANGPKYVIVESVYSMDGDQAPLEQLVELCEEQEAYLIVDEAHATGIIGEDGGGLSMTSDIYRKIFARIYTFGKGIGYHGACIAGSRSLIDYLINFSRSFIYTTALPKNSYSEIIERFKYLHAHPELSSLLSDKIALYNRELKKIGLPTGNATPIQTVIIPDTKKLIEKSIKLQKNGFDVRPILSPTVPQGKERLRICLHTFNTDQEIINLVAHLK